MYESIPKELKELKQWVCWSGDKLPKNPNTGKNAQSNNPNTWSDYETAVSAVEKYMFDGIGFMFDNGYFGVDLDDCSDELRDEFTKGLNSYTEISKSGTGIHIICKGTLPEGRRRKNNVEMYDGGRYFIMTGKTFLETTIKDCTETIKPLHEKYVNDLRKPKSIGFIPTSKTIKLNDDEVISKIRSSKNGFLFQALFSGNWEGIYPSQSEADYEMCKILAFWTGKDSEQMDRIFRSSHLFREKWDRKQSGTTYGQITIANANNKTNSVFGGSNVAEYFVGKDGEVYEKPTKQYQLNDTGNSERLVDKFYGLIKYNHDNKMWMIWDGKVWREDNTLEVKRLADKVIEEMKVEAFLEDDENKRKELMKNVQRAFSTKGKEAMIKEAMHLPNVPILNYEFDKEKDLFNCQNGIIKLRTGELIEHSPSFYQTKIGTSILGEGEPKRWLQFLEEITNGDKELIKFIQKSVGYSLTGSVEEQCLFFCYGTGQNGKTVFLDIITELLGSYTTNTQPETIMLKTNTSSANSDVARLKGARFVTSVEPNEGVRLNEGLIKQLTGGDKVTARFLYGKEFEFNPEFKLWLATNHKPVVRGTDDGIWRRIRLIPFTVKISENKKDKQLKQKLLKELPQILRWAFEGCQLWLKEGLEMPKSVLDATADYRNEMDVVNNFVETCTMPVTGFRENASNMYQKYVQWAQVNNEYEMSSTRFGRELAKRFDKVRHSNGTYYMNVKLIDEDEIKPLGYSIKKNAS